MDGWNVYSLLLLLLVDYFTLDVIVFFFNKDWGLEGVSVVPSIERVIEVVD